MHNHLPPSPSTIHPHPTTGPLNEQEQRYPVFVYDTKDVVMIKPSNLMLDTVDNVDSIRIRGVPQNKVMGDDFKKEESAKCMDISLLKGVEYRLKDNATIWYYRHFLKESRAKELFQEFSKLNYEQSEFQIRGQTVCSFLNARVSNILVHFRNVYTFTFSKNAVA